MSANDNQAGTKHIVTIERWEDGGDLEGAYLVTVSLVGSSETIDGRILGDKEDAMDFARGLLSAFPDAIFHDQSGEASA